LTVLRWDDLQLLLCIDRAGSFAGAAARLGVSTPTVFRQAKALEQRLGTLVFHRDTTGVTLTAAGREAVIVAERLEEEVSQLETHISGLDAGFGGTVRLATVDTLVAGPLLPVLARLRHAQPALLIDLRVGIRMADLRGREVDAALRAGGDPPESLVGRRLCRISVAVYRAANLAKSVTLDTESWIAPGEELGHLASARWIRERVQPLRVAMYANSLHSIGSAVASGMGLGILPCYFADLDPRLTRVSETIGELASDLWFLTHNELRSAARIGAVSDHFAREFHALRPLFEGKRPLNQPEHS
jgi:DNA-binding transcriptional LysR family regulator